MKKRENSQPGKDAMPAGNSPRTSSNAKKARLVICYVLYAAAVLMVGAKLGAFHMASSASSNTNAAPQAVAFEPPTVAGQPVALAKGILAFDEEVKQSTVHEGEKQAQFVFNLTNISREPITIGKVETSCGCTAAKLPQLPWVLKPRENGQIPVTMNLQGYFEKNSKYVKVLTSKGYKTLEVDAIILPAAK